MDINTRLDGFIIHPLDAFNEKHREESIPKFSITAPNLDGFQVHPIDNFISQMHNDDIYNNNDINQTTNIFSNNEISETGNIDYNNNIYNYNDSNQAINTFSNNEIYETGNIDYNNNIYNNNNVINQTNSTFINNNVYETGNILNINNDINNYGLLSISPDINNNYNYNQYETYNTTSQIYPVSYIEPSSNYNYDYLNNDSSNIISINQGSNYINTTTSSYVSYPSTNFNYSNILPTNYLPPAKNTIDNNSLLTINLEPKINEAKYATPSIIPPSKSVYTIPSYKTIQKKESIPLNIIETNTSKSKILPVSKITYNGYPHSSNHFSVYSYNFKNNKSIITNYKLKPIELPPKTYTIKSYNHKIKWKKIIPKMTTVVIPTVKRFIIPRRIKYVLPKAQKVLSKSVLVQPIPSTQISIVPSPFPKDSIRKINMPPILSTLPNNYSIQTVPITNPNNVKVNLNGLEKYPKDNNKRLVPTYKLPRPKIYYASKL